MAFDAMALHAVMTELNGLIVGGRIEKAFQPEKDEIDLLIRNHFENYRLLISASPLYSRIHLSASSKPNPAKAPMFCMLLRKYIVGGRITALRQWRFDRVLEMDISAFDELGAETLLTLRMEVMGRHSNIILTGGDLRIYDSVKRVNEERSRVREILPGLRYEYPPAQDKLMPDALDARALAQVFAQRSDITLSAALFQGVAGLSPDSAKEFILFAGDAPQGTAAELSADALEQLCARLMQRFTAVATGCYSPHAIPSLEQPEDFYPFAHSAAPRQEAVQSFSAALDAYYLSRDLKERLRQKCSSMTQILHLALTRAQRKLEKQEASLADASGLEEYRLKGELLTASLYLMKKGMENAEVTNYYDPQGGTMVIPLDKRLTPAQNAQSYYKKYAKAKATLEKLRQHYEDTLAEIQYLQGQLLNIENCATEADVEDIRGELLALGYVKPQKNAVKKQLPASRPMQFMTSDGFTVFVGRNNAQNDRLTFRLARADDIWMHTKNIPGSHVILQTGGKTPSDTALRESALLAAYYSQARTSSAVPVDYTQRRNVKKPNGARPGFVIYLTNQTLYASPDEQMVAGLKRIDQ